MAEQPQLIIPLEYATDTTDTAGFVVRIIAIVAIVKGLADASVTAVYWWQIHGLVRGSSSGFSLVDWYEKMHATYIVLSLWLLFAGLACARPFAAGRWLTLAWAYANVLATGGLQAYRAWCMLLETADRSTIYSANAFALGEIIRGCAVPMLVIFLFHHRAFRAVFAHGSGRFR